MKRPHLSSPTTAFTARSSPGSTDWSSPGSDAPTDATSEITSASARADTNRFLFRISSPPSISVDEDRRARLPFPLSRRQASRS